MNAGVFYIVAAGLAGSASADQSTVSVHVVVVTSAVGTLVVVSVGLEWIWQILFGLFDISEEDEIEDCSYQTNRFFHPLRG